MVAVRRKVGSRGFLRTKQMTKGKKIVKIDCSIPANDGIFDAEMLAAFEQYFNDNVKLHGRKGKLMDKVKIGMDANVLTLSTTMKFQKRYFKYLTKKFLKKKNLRDWLRILATGKQQYQLRYFNIDQQEEATE
jgi:large subunit ribosomal protein L22e